MGGITAETDSEILKFCFEAKMLQQICSTPSRSTGDELYRTFIVAADFESSADHLDVEKYMMGTPVELSSFLSFLSLCSSLASRPSFSSSK